MLPTLFPYLVNEEKAADYFSHQRWPHRVSCPYCGNEDITKRERSANGFQRYNCPHCATKAGQQYLTFTAWTETVFENSKIKPTIWLLVIALWELKLNATEIAQAAGLNQQSAQRCINLLDGSIYESYHLDPTRQLEGQVEADECYQTAGTGWPTMHLRS